jgi:hypothetical protein
MRALLCMQRARAGDPGEVAATLHGWGQRMDRLCMTRSGPDDLAALFSYVSEVAALGDDQLHTILTDITPRSHRKMITAAEHIRRRVRPKYVAAGKALLLLRLLEKKFDVLPTKLVARIKRARSEALDRWGDQILDAKSLDEVFAEG